MMKKLVLTLVLLALVGFAGLGVYAYLTGFGEPLTMRAEPPNVQPEGERDFPTAYQSTVAVRMEIPVAALAASANANKPKDFAGAERKNFHKRIKRGTVQWRLIPGNIALKNNRRNLAFGLPIRGAARVTGDFDAAILSIPIEGEADLVGNVTGTMNPRVTSDWQIVPNLNPTLKLTRADLTLNRLGTVSAREVIEDLANPLLKEEAAKVGPDIMRGLDLSKNLQRLWADAHLGMQVCKDPKAWLVFDPESVSMSPFEFDDPVNMSVTMGMEAQTFVSSVPVNLFYPEKLPPLQNVRQKPVNNIKVPFVLDIGEVNKALTTRTFETDAGLGGTRAVISEPEIRIGKQGVLYFGLTIDADTGPLGRNFSGRIWIEAKPSLDPETQTLGLTNVKLTENTRKALPGPAAKAIESFVVKAIEEELQADLDQFFPLINEEMQVWLSEHPIAEGIELSIPNPEIKLLELYTINRPAKDAEPSPGVVAVFGGRGEVIMKITKF